MKIFFILLASVITFLTMIWAAETGNIALALIVSGVAWAVFVVWIVKLDPPR